MAAVFDAAAGAGAPKGLAGGALDAEAPNVKAGCEAAGEAGPGDDAVEAAPNGLLEAAVPKADVAPKGDLASFVTPKGDFASFVDAEAPNEKPVEAAGAELAAPNTLLPPLVLPNENEGAGLALVSAFTDASAFELVAAPNVKVGLVVASFDEVDEGVPNENEGFAGSLVAVLFVVVGAAPKEKAGFDVAEPLSSVVLLDPKDGCLLGASESAPFVVAVDAAPNEKAGLFVDCSCLGPFESAGAAPNEKAGFFEAWSVDAPNPPKAGVVLLIFSPLPLVAD